MSDPCHNEDCRTCWPTDYLEGDYTLVPERMRVTASKVGLLSSCQWFARPEAEWDTSTSAAADRGTRFHAAIAHYVEHGKWVPADDGSDEDIVPLFLSARAWVDHFGRDALRAEVAFAWDPAADTAWRLKTEGRDYAAEQARGHICGTADIVAISRATRVGYIADWKTGDGSGAGPQLRALALMLARAENLDSVTVEALEVSDTGVRHVCTETLDAFALAAVAGELAEAAASIATAEPQPGPHCGDQWCPARATCPAVRERIADIIPAAELVRHRWGLAIEGPDHAAWLYAQAKAVEAAAKLVKDAVKAYVPEGGITLADGSVLAEGTRNVERFDKARAFALLRELGATEEQIETCSRTVQESSGLRLSGGAAKPRKRRAA